MKRKGENPESSCLKWLKEHKMQVKAYELGIEGYRGKDIRNGELKTAGTEKEGAYERRKETARLVCRYSGKIEGDRKKSSDRRDFDYRDSE